MASNLSINTTMTTPLEQWLPSLLVRVHLGQFTFLNILRLSLLVPWPNSQSTLIGRNLYEGEIAPNDPTILQET